MWWCFSNYDHRFGLKEVISKKVFQPDRKGIIPVRGYSDIRKQDRLVVAGGEGGQEDPAREKR
jgi:hypothetical protein